MNQENYFEKAKLKQFIDDYRKEKNFYEDILSKLKQLQEILKTTKNSLIKIEKEFKKGAFISNNETFDKGTLNTDYDIMDEDVTALDLVIINMEKKIKALENSIILCNKKYNIL